MKLFIVLSCLIATSFALTMSHADYEWEDWKEKNVKSYYDNRDENVRRDIWKKNQAFVDQHNLEASQGKHSYKVEMNKFADLSTAEFSKIFLGLARPGGMNSEGCSNMSIYVTSHNYGALPDSIDWRNKDDKDYVSPVKDQGQCGSCWAFSTTGSLEGQHFKQTGTMVSLSEQNLMDCSRPEGDFSCGGGLMDYAFKYIIENKGIDTEDSYPYEAKDENICKFKRGEIGATMTSCVDVTPRGDESALQKAVGTIGPISVAIDASRPSFQLYASGIYDEPTCSSTMLDHGVLVVGYGSDGGDDFWIVKNSWGAVWGDHGYLKMSRNKNNQCGIATSASYPVV